MKRSATKPFLVLSGVSLRVGERLLFRNTRWNFARGQHWALVGSNAAGKTLLACALAGEIPVVAGEIVYYFRLTGGRAPEDAVAHVSFEQHKAAAGDSPAAARWLDSEEHEAVTVGEFLSRDRVEEINPFEIVETRRRPPAAFERRRRQVVRLLQIESLRDRVLPSLSNGEMRKTLLARALLRHPRLLILDDPFSGLDSRFRVHLKQILAHLMREGKVRLLLIANRREDLPRGITHMMLVHRCRILAQGRLRPMLVHPSVRKLHLSADAPSTARSPVRVAAPSRAESSEVLVHMNHVGVRYGRHAILEDIDWTIRRGESWALLGPNGSGKSALLSLIIGDNPQAYANRVYLFGRQRGTGESVWELKRRIGWVSPELHLHFPEAQTCLEAVISGLHDSHGLYRRPTRLQVDLARRWLVVFGLSASASQPLGSLSAGMQRMVLLARALVKTPELLVLDEPCQGLDSRHRKLFLNAVESLLRRNETTVIYVTHRSDEIPAGIVRVLRLRNGRAVGSRGLGGRKVKSYRI